MPEIVPAPDPIPTRHSLLNRLKDWDDQTSWQEFFDTYWRLIYSVAIKAGLSDAEAQEVVQETVIGVARKISEFKADPAHGSFSTAANVTLTGTAGGQNLNVSSVRVNGVTASLNPLSGAWSITLPISATAGTINPFYAELRNTQNNATSARQRISTGRPVDDYSSAGQRREQRSCHTE